MNKTYKVILFLLIISVFIPMLNIYSFGMSNPIEPFFFGDVVAVISNYYNNKNYPTVMSLRYNQKIENKKTTEYIEIYFNDYLNRACITFISRDRKKFIKLIDNVLKTIKDQTEKIDKDIGDLKIDISWKQGDNEWIETQNSKMFVKVTTAIDKKYQMTISFTEGISENNKYKPGILYLYEDSINKLKTILSDDNYNSFLKKAKSKK